MCVCEVYSNGHVFVCNESQFWPTSVLPYESQKVGVCVLPNTGVPVRGSSKGWGLLQGSGDRMDVSSRSQSQGDCVQDGAGAPASAHAPHFASLLSPFGTTAGQAQLHPHRCVWVGVLSVWVGGCVKCVC